MQALTGLFARQFGTPNYAARRLLLGERWRRAQIYTVGGSFWEFGGPDSSGLEAVRDDRHGRRPPQQPDEDRARRNSSARAAFISINPVRTGYSAIADEWIPIRPGTDGALFRGAAARA